MGEHPFWVRERGWVEAQELVAGDELFTSSGGWLRVAGGTWTGHTATVYNFEVAGTHIWFVGDSAVWVHNLCAADLDALERVASKFPILSCKDCADKLAKAVRSRGLQGKVVEINVPTARHGFIHSDAAGTGISQNGRHWGVEVDGVVFDNVHKRGVPRAEWERDFWADSSSLPDLIASGRATVTETCVGKW